MKRGFTLVEIMIVVAVIALLAAIAIPNILRARHNANEASAIASLRAISTAMEGYRGAQIPSEYTGATLSTLRSSSPPYMDTKLGSGSKQGYDFVLNIDSAQTYDATGTPQQYHTTGTRSFIVQEDGVIKCLDNSGAALARGEGTALD